MHNFFFSDHLKNSTVKRNFYLNVFDGAIFAFAMSFVSLQTVFPVLVKKISGSDFAIGLIPVIYTAGFNFPQIFVANYVRKKSFKKSFFLKTAFGQRLPWFFISLVLFLFVEDLNRDVALILILSGLGFAAVAGSINLPGWFDLISKLTPVELRGRLFAYRSIIGSILGVAGGATVVIILKSVDYPENFGILFMLTFIIMMISYVFLLFIKEDEPNPPPEIFNYSKFFQRLTIIIKSEKNFRNFIISDALMMLANMSHAFFAVYAIEKYSLPESYAGNFTIVMMASMIIGSLFFGYAADRFGHKNNLVYASAFTGFACLTAIISPSSILYYFVFVCSALNITVLMVSRLTIVAEICYEDDRPTYIALMNLVTAPFVLSGLFGGLIVKLYGFNVLFSLAAIFSLAAFVWLIFNVKEPRIISHRAK